MKHLIFFIIFELICSYFVVIQTAPIYQLDDTNVNEQWNSFKSKYNRTYDSESDKQRLFVKTLL